VIFEKVHRLVTGTEADATVTKELGQLRALAGVSKFPMRVKCASLAWHALKSAMDGAEPAVQGAATT
jgi:nitrogen fixation NifU-like protein